MNEALINECLEALKILIRLGYDRYGELYQKLSEELEIAKWEER